MFNWFLKRNKKINNDDILQQQYNSTYGIVNSITIGIPNDANVKTVVAKIKSNTNKSNIEKIDIINLSKHQNDKDKTIDIWIGKNTSKSLFNCDNIFYFNDKSIDLLKSNIIINFSIEIIVDNKIKYSYEKNLDEIEVTFIDNKRNYFFIKPQFIDIYTNKYITKNELCLIYC